MHLGPISVFEDDYYVQSLCKVSAGNYLNWLILFLQKQWEDFRNPIKISEFLPRKLKVLDNFYLNDPKVLDNFYV